MIGCTSLLAESGILRTRAASGQRSRAQPPPLLQLRRRQQVSRSPPAPLLAATAGRARCRRLGGRRRSQHLHYNYAVVSSDSALRQVFPSLGLAAICHDHFVISQPQDHLTGSNSSIDRVIAWNNCYKRTVMRLLSTEKLPDPPHTFILLLYQSNTDYDLKGYSHVPPSKFSDILFLEPRPVREFQPQFGLPGISQKTPGIQYCKSFNHYKNKYIML